MRYRIALVACIVSFTATAGESNVIEAKAQCTDNICSFQVTLEHADTGWDHYANHWRVLTIDGRELGRRVLHHPHVDEQPFTRSLSNVEIPSDISQVVIESHDSVHEYGGVTIQVNIR